MASLPAARPPAGPLQLETKARRSRLKNTGFTHSYSEERETLHPHTLACSLHLTSPRDSLSWAGSQAKGSIGGWMESQKRGGECSESWEDISLCNRWRCSEITWYIWWCCNTHIYTHTHTTSTILPALNLCLGCMGTLSAPPWRWQSAMGVFGSRPPLASPLSYLLATSSKPRAPKWRGIHQLPTLRDDVINEGRLPGGLRLMADMDQNHGEGK